jgi:hypothetical protein
MLFWLATEHACAFMGNSSLLHQPEMSTSSAVHDIADSALGMTLLHGGHPEIPATPSGTPSNDPQLLALCPPDERETSQLRQRVAGHLRR